MKPKKRLLLKLSIPVAMAALMPASLSAATVFFDDFSGDTGDINGLAPDTRPGTENWVAANVFNADGSFGGNPGSATLAFAPQQGLIYTLDISLAFTRAGAGAWLGLGFAKGQSADAINGNRFLGVDTIGQAWTFFRANTNNPNASLGDGANGLASAELWTTLFPETTDGNPVAIDMRVVLDTTAGVGTWAATWFAKNTADSTFVKVRDTANLLSEDIDSVGLALSGTGFNGNVDNFSLTSIPEPSVALLGAFGALGLFRRRR